MDFKPISTQEEFEAAIKDRLKRERETARKEAVKELAPDYEELKTRSSQFEAEKNNYDVMLREGAAKISEHEKEKGELAAKLKKYESDSIKTRIAIQLGLPFELSSRISGETEDEIKKDAEALARLVGRQTPPAPPLRDSEPEISPKDAAFRTLLGGLKTKGD